MTKPGRNPLSLQLLEVQRTLGWMDLVLGSIDDAVCVTDKDDRLVFANDYFSQLVSTSRVFMLGQKMHDVFPVTETGRPLAEFVDQPNKLAESDTGYNGVFEYSGSGAKKVFKISSRLLPNIDQTVFLIQDITREYEFAQAKNKFVDLASHQLRTPMTAIMTYAHLLQDGFAGGLTAEQQRLVATIVSSSERMIGLVNGLLTITRAQNGLTKIDFQTVDLKEIFARIHHELAPQLDKKQLGLSLDIPSRLPELLSDKGILHEIFSNLLVNAVQYTPAGGSITATVVREKTAILIHIKDSGIGIPPAYLPLLFEQFSRADNAIEAHPEGTGLGLYLIKILLAKLDGSISCRSTVGQGTTFTVRLPLQASSRPGSRSAGPGSSSSHAGSRRTTRS